MSDIEHAKYLHERLSCASDKTEAIEPVWHFIAELLTALHGKKITSEDIKEEINEQ